MKKSANEHPGTETESTIAVVEELLKYFNLHLSKSLYNDLIFHPQFPGIVSISDFLHEHDIDNMVVGLTLHQLHEAPLPAIAFLSDSRRSKFVLLTECRSSDVVYYDGKRKITESIADYSGKWHGAILLVEQNEKSKQNVKTQRTSVGIDRMRSYVLAGSLLMLFALAILLLSNSLIPFFLVKTFGIILCVMILRMEFGVLDHTTSNICQIGSKSSCDDVINSPGSKLFGMIHLSELGLIYFTGGVMALLLSGVDALPILRLLDFFAIPVTLFSIFYQALAVKKWCPLCLLIVVVIWLETIAMLTTPPGGLFTTRAIANAMTGFIIPCSIWLAVRSSITKLRRAADLERSLNKFKRSDRLFLSMLEREEIVEVGRLPEEITEGNSSAPITITLVANPTCGPCGRAFRSLQKAIKQADGGLIKLNLRFVVNTRNPESTSYQMLKHLAGLHLSRSRETFNSISEWFAQDRDHNLTRWKKKYPHSQASTLVNEIDSFIQQQQMWARNGGVTSTPTIFINNRKYPHEFPLDDLPFQIRKLTEMMETQ